MLAELPCLFTISVIEQAQAAFVTASIHNFDLQAIEDVGSKTITGRLKSIRLRDKTKEAELCREVISTTGEEV